MKHFNEITNENYNDAIYELENIESYSDFSINKKLQMQYQELELRIDKFRSEKGYKIYPKSKAIKNNSLSNKYND